MVRLWVILLYAGLSLSFSAQENFRELLKSEIAEQEDPIQYLKNRETDSQLEKAIIANTIGLQFQYSSELDSALKYHRKAKDISLINCKNCEELGISLNKIGIIHYYKGEIDSARNIMIDASEFFTTPKLKANCFNNIALMNKYLERPEEAIQNYQSALNIYKESSDSSKMITVLNNIGSLHFDMENLELAENYSSQALSIAVGTNNTPERFSCMESIANINFAKENYSYALEIHLECLQYYENQKNPSQEIISGNNAANCYSELGQNQKALTYYRKALRTMESVGIEKNKESILSNIGSTFQVLENNDSAKIYYQKALLFARQNKIILRLPSIYIGLSNIYKIENNIDSSLYYKDLQIALHDSLDKIEKEKKLLELESKYQNEELKGNLASKDDLLTESEKKLELFSTGLFISLSIILVTVVLVVLLFKRYNKTRDNVTSLEKKQITNEKELASLNSELKDKDNKLRDLNLQLEGSLKPYPDYLSPLTSREKEVLLGVKEGLKDQEIADKLFLSITTIRTHLRKAYGKIDVRNRAEAIKFINEFEI